MILWKLWFAISMLFSLKRSFCECIVQIYFFQNIQNRKKIFAFFLYISFFFSLQWASKISFWIFFCFLRQILFVFTIYMTSSPLPPFSMVPWHRFSWEYPKFSSLPLFLRYSIIFMPKKLIIEMSWSWQFLVNCCIFYAFRSWSTGIKALTKSIPSVIKVCIY